MRPAKAYKNTNINTASRGDLVVMLYDGFLRYANQAVTAIGDQDPARTGKFIGKAMAIVQELAASLNPEPNPELAKSLEALYFFVEDQLLKANQRRDPERVLSCIHIMKDLRDAWAEAARMVNV